MLFSVYSLRDDNTKSKTDPQELEVYRFKVGVRFWDTV